jgi:hypothetical protein
VKENWYNWDADGRKVANHKVVGLPGFRSPIGGSLPDVAMRHLCAGATAGERAVPALTSPAAAGSGRRRGVRLSGNPSPLNAHVRDRGGLGGRCPLDSGVGIAR